MPFSQSHLDSTTAAIAAVASTKAQHDAARSHLDEQLAALSDGLAEGDVRLLSGPAPAVTKVNGIVKYVIVPGLLDPDAPVTA